MNDPEAKLRAQLAGIRAGLYHHRRVVKVEGG